MGATTECQREAERDEEILDRYFVKVTLGLPEGVEPPDPKDFNAQHPLRPMAAALTGQLTRGRWSDPWIVWGPLRDAVTLGFTYTHTRERAVNPPWAMQPLSDAAHAALWSIWGALDSVGLRHVPIVRFEVEAR